MAKNNIRSVRFSDEMIEIINQQVGENFTQKFERMVYNCYMLLPEKERQAERLDTNTQLLTPLTRRCWFVTNKDYAAYDTLACVGNLQKSFKEGDMLSEEEILSLRRNEQQANMDGVVKPSRKWRRSQKKLRK